MDYNCWCILYIFCSACTRVRVHLHRKYIIRIYIYYIQNVYLALKVEFFCWKFEDEHPKFCSMYLEKKFWLSLSVISRPFTVTRRGWIWYESGIIGEISARQYCNPSKSPPPILVLLLFFFFGLFRFCNQIIHVVPL